jgi:hypothetical protein
MSAPISEDGILAAQTSALIEAETTIKNIAAVHSLCPFRLRLGNVGGSRDVGFAPMNGRHEAQKPSPKSAKN